MSTKHNSIRLASEGDYDTVSTDSLGEMRNLAQAYAEDPHGAVLDGWEPREGTIITEVRAISARINQNYDAWPSEELREAHHTFLGKPVFINHNNHDPDQARGRVVASRYVDAGEHDRYIQVLQEVEASRFPKLAKELMEGGLDSVSMGAEAREVECSYCGNISTSPFDACEHIPMKGSTLQRRTASGTKEDVLVYEICRKISFFELSYVFDPADETAVASNVLVANRKAFNDVEAPPNVDTLHPDEDEKSQDDWQEFVDDPNVIDTIDVLDEPDLGLNQELERSEDEVPEGFEEFENVDEQIEENERAERELAQDARQKSKDKEEAEAEEAQKRFEKADPEDEKNWEEEDDGTGGKTSRFKGGNVEAMVADDYGTFNMWVEKNGSLIASDSYTNFREAKSAAVMAIKQSMEEKKMSASIRRRTSRRMTADAWDDAVNQAVSEGGFTFVSTPGDGPNSGFMVSVADEKRVPIDESRNPDDVRDFMQANSSLLSKPNHYVGGWVEGGELCMDVSINVSSEEEAREIGEANNQDGIFDLNTGQTIMLKQGRRATRKQAWSSLTQEEKDRYVNEYIREREEKGGGAHEACDHAYGICLAPNKDARRKTAYDENLYKEFLQYAKNQGFDLNYMEDLLFDDPENPAYFEFEEAMLDFLGTNDVDDSQFQGLLEAPGIFGIVHPDLNTANRKARQMTATHYGLNELLGLSTPHPQDPNVKVVTLTLSGGDTAYLPGTTKGAIGGEGEITYYIQPMGTNYEAQGDLRQVPIPAGYFASRNGALHKHAEYDDGEMCVDCLMIIANDDDSGMSAEQAAASREGIADWRAEGVQLVPGDFVDPSFSSSPCEVCGTRLAGDRVPVSFMKIGSRRNGGRRISRTNTRATSTRSNRMAPQRRRRIGDNKQTPLLEETGIAQTPAEEPAVDPGEGADAPNNSESDRVKSARRALAREIARDRAAKRRQGRTASYADMSDFDLQEMHGELENAVQDGDDSAIAQMEEIEAEADKRGLDLYDPNFDPNERAFMSRRRRQAAPVGADLSGESVKREDLFQDYPATTMTAKLHKRFAAWVQENYGASLRQASGPGELRSWARAFSREAGIDLPRLHAAIKRDIHALRTAEDNDLPDFIEEKIEDDEDVDDKKQARRRAIARRRAAQARNARGRRTQTTRRRTADDKLDVAAPGDRVNVEKPTSGTTDADAEASQFDKADFDNNSGKGLENPDTTPTAGTPGGPSVNDLKKTSRATGLQAVRLAEAMIAAGLLEDSTESKFKAAAQFEQMSRDIVLDRTALLEKVSKVHANRRPSTTKNAGNRGSSLNSAVPPNMSGMTRSSAPQTREASTDNDSDLFI